MSNDKLSELKAVADYWRKVKSGELPAPGPNEISITVCTLDAAVSRIAALLAELEEKDKRITELEAIRSDASQAFKEIGSELGCNPDNESIMMAIDEMKEKSVAMSESDAQWAVMLYEKNLQIVRLEAKLATPVRLPEREFDDGSDKQVCILAGRFNSGIDKSAKAIRAAGFKCVGDEQ